MEQSLNAVLPALHRKTAGQNIARGNSVGSKLLLGQIIDTNAVFLATQLSRLGVDVHRKQTVGDNLERIIDCICAAVSSADCLVITGGLGPSTDDMTREGIAPALGVPLLHRQELKDELRAWFAARDIPLVFARRRTGSSQ